MPARIANNSYNTNLASEYLMMSMLCRAGKDAYLSLGNKKGVDIMIKTEKEALCILEVKGVNKKMDWLIGNSGNFPCADNLFYALICFDGNIEDVNASAFYYLIPSMVIKKQKDYATAGNGKTIFLRHKTIKEKYESYKNNLSALNKYLKSN